MLEGCAFQSVADSRDPASEEGSTSSAGRKVVVRIRYMVNGTLQLDGQHSQRPALVVLFKVQSVELGPIDCLSLVSRLSVLVLRGARRETKCDSSRQS